MKSILLLHSLGQGVDRRLHSSRVRGESIRPSFCVPGSSDPPLFIGRGLFAMYRCTVSAHSPSFCVQRLCTSMTPLGYALL